MEDTRHAIRQGRVLADEGFYAHAMETWKAALSGAYNSQDYAGMFVLSVNIGEVCVRIATQSKDKSKGFQLLLEAKANLEYALQIVEKCSLREVLGGYRALYQGVIRAEMLKRKAEKLMNKLQREMKEKQVCTTCGGAGEVLLDENDGCFYCKKCYDEYYAFETEGEAGTGDDVSAGEEKNNVVDGDGGGVDDEWRSQGGDDGDAEPVTLESDMMTEVVEDAAISEDEQIEETDEEETKELTHELAHESIEDVKQDRIRYERVELGSLADFLAGKLHVEDKAQTQQNDVSTDTLAPEGIRPADGLNGEFGAEPTSTINDYQEEHCESDTATSDEGVTNVKEALALDKAGDTADTTTNKRVYSIAQLLDLRKISPIDCPETLLASPVRDDGTTPTPSRNKASNSRKKSNSKKTSRSASHPKSSSNQGEIPDATPSISPLPTLDLCIAMRKTLEEHQEGSDLSCDNFIVGTTTETAITFL